MQMTEQGLLALVRHEGIVPGPYLDVKQVWTFGIGHTAAAGRPDPATMPRGMPADLDVGTVGQNNPLSISPQGQLLTGIFTGHGILVGLIAGQAG